MRGLLIETTHGDVRISVDASTVSHLDTSAGGENIDKILALLNCWISILADSPLNSGRRSEKPPRVFRHFVKEFLETPLLTTIRRYSGLADRLLTLPTQLSSTGEFIPEFRDTPIFKEYHEWYKSGSAELFQYLLTFCIFAKKVDYKDEEFDSVAFRGWQAVEARLSDLLLDQETLDVLRVILTGLVGRVPRSEPIFGRFGPGFVSEPGVWGRIKKSNDFHFDPKIDRLLFKSHWSNFGDSEEYGFHPSKILPGFWNWDSAKKHSRTFSRLKFVPKDVTKSRSICMEPNVYMFAQQLCLDVVLKCMKRASASRFVDITDQSINREAARFGSLTGLVDTIDLSSASDSVSWDLVKSIFPPDLLVLLAATRTSKVQTPDGNIIPVKKFAPMGSALCFPTQCLVFTSVVVYSAIARASGCWIGEPVHRDNPFLKDIPKFISEYFSRKLRKMSPRSKAYQPASVYGDDICVDHKLTPYVTHLLSSLGFEVNLPKSFCGSQSVRESCGGYYYRGVDVTPLRLRLKNFSLPLTASGVTSMISLSNQAGDRHYRNLRRCLIHYILFSKLRDLPSFDVNPFRFVERGCRSGSYDITTTVTRNTHLRWRRFGVDPGNSGETHIRYQRDEYKCILGTADESHKVGDVDSPALEAYLYQRWWGDRTGGFVTGEHTASYLRCDSSGSRLCWRWMPVQ